MQGKLESCSSSGCRDYIGVRAKRSKTSKYKPHRLGNVGLRVF